MDGQILVAQKDGHHFVKMVGDVRLTLAISFDRFIKDMYSQRFQSVTFDLRDAKAIDSTTLGLMANIAMEARNFGFRPLVLLQSACIKRILEVMGFVEIMDIVEGSAADMASGKAESLALQTIEASEEEVRAKVIEAHKTLISLCQANELQFSELVESLEQAGR